jgi:exonuclease III
VEEAQRRGRAAAGCVRCVTLNHGGFLVRLREAVQERARLRRAAATIDVDEVALVAQADARLFRTMAAHAAEADAILGQETHLLRGDGERETKLRGLLTTGPFEGWRLLLSNAPADDAYAGLFIWYNSETIEMLPTAAAMVARAARGEGRGGGQASPEEWDARFEVEPGRLMLARVRLRADGTEFDLANVYMPVADGDARRLALMGEMREELEEAADAAFAAGREFVIAGDLQAQTARARASQGKLSGGQEDAWIDKFEMATGMISASGGGPTYVAEGGAVQTEIDHWLLSEDLLWRAHVRVGVGADGVVLGGEVEGDEAEEVEAGGAAEEKTGAARPPRKGHNSLVLHCTTPSLGSDSDPS